MVGEYIIVLRHYVALFSSFKETLELCHIADCNSVSGLRRHGRYDSPPHCKRGTYKIHMKEFKYLTAILTLLGIGAYFALQYGICLCNWPNICTATMLLLFFKTVQLVAIWYRTAILSKPNFLVIYVRIFIFYYEIKYMLRTIRLIYKISKDA